MCVCLCVLDIQIKGSQAKPARNLFFDDLWDKNGFYTFKVCEMKQNKE